MKNLKPEIYLNFDDSAVGKLKAFLQFLSNQFKDESNLKITTQVLECLMFIKLNRDWIKYAIENKDDETLYRDPEDRDGRILRAPNGIIFYNWQYENFQRIWSIYSIIFRKIENKVDYLIQNPLFVRSFIREIQNNKKINVALNLKFALEFIVTPTTLTSSIFENCLIAKNGTQYAINFSDKQLAEKYLNLIQLAFPSVVYEESRNIVVQKQKVNSEFCYYQFLLTSEQFNFILTLFPTTNTENLILKKSIFDITKELRQAILADNPSGVITLISSYPGLKNFCVGFAPKSVSELWAGNIYESVGELPIHFAIRNNKLKIINTLVQDCKVNINPQLNLLIYATVVEDVTNKTINKISLIPGVEVNGKSKVGETALFIAAMKGYVSKIKILLSIKNINLLVKREKDYKTAIQIAEENKFFKIAGLIKKQKPIRQKALEKETVEVRKKHHFEDYALTLRKMPNRDLYFDYLQDVNDLKDKNSFITQTEKEYVKTRKLWSDVVSEVFATNELQKGDVKQKVLDRLKKFYTGNLEWLYEKCVEYLRENSVITLTFNASFLKKGLTDFQPLNVWEKDNRQNQSYNQTREQTEKNLFNFLVWELRNNFISNKHARPSYAALLNLDCNTPVRQTSGYGLSFIVFKDLAKYNALFSPADSFCYQQKEEKSYETCTFHHFEFLLWQCPDVTLKAIIARVTKGELPAEYNQNDGDHFETAGGYIEVMLPRINIFDANLVEHIHINSNEHQVPKKDMQAIQARGINVTNSLETPYVEFNKQFMKAVENDDANKAKELLSKNPSLIKISDKEGNLPIHIAAQYGSIKILNLFYQKKVNFSVYSPKDLNALHVAVQYNQKEALNLIIDMLQKRTKKPIPNIINEQRGFSALHIASREGRLDIIKYLIAKGADVNAKAMDGSTPVDLAVKYHQKEVIEILKNNSDFSVEENQRQSWELFVEDESQKVQNLDNKNKKELASGLIRGDINCFEKFKKQGKNWWELPLNNENYLALHLAVVGGKFGLVKILVEEYNANIDSKISHSKASWNGGTPLLLAAELKKDFNNIFEYLIAKGADINIATKKGETPISIAVKNCDREKVNLLLSAYEKNKLFKESAASPINLKKALLLANKKGYKDIARAIAKVYLSFYIAETEKREAKHYKNRISFFGKSINFGYSAEEKLAAGIALMSCAENPAGKEEKEKMAGYKGELNNGELGMIREMLNIKI